MGSSGGRVFLPIGVDDDGEPIFDVPADDRYNPETAEKESEAVQTILEALKTAGDQDSKTKGTHQETTSTTLSPLLSCIG